MGLNSQSNTNNDFSSTQADSLNNNGDFIKMGVEGVGIGGLAIERHKMGM